MRSIFVFIAVTTILWGLLQLAYSKDLSMSVYLSAVFTTRNNRCDDSYPTVCIPSSPPDLDCVDVLPLVDFKVLPPDPHEFDRDKDGIGCESEL